MFFLKRNKPVTPLVLLFSLFFLSCDIIENYYIFSSENNTDDLKQLMHLLDEKQISCPDKFAIVQEICQSYIRHNAWGKLINFLGEYVDSNSSDPYNAYHLYTIALAYKTIDSKPVAAVYFDRIVKNFPDLVVKDESIHCSCLSELIISTSDPVQRINYRKELIARFPNKIDPGREYFLLGKDYEIIGEWNKAIESYRKYLPYYDSIIPGYPEAFTWARNMVDFVNSPKDWTFENLDSLVITVKNALNSASAYKLSSLRAKVGFFAMSWHQNLNAGSSSVLFDFSPFIGGQPISYSPTLESISNSTEAYLRTWGWTDRTMGWTFYFRKINFPADPEIHGRWEWAGIYYGERVE